MIRTHSRGSRPPGTAATSDGRDGQRARPLIMTWCAVKAPSTGALQAGNVPVCQVPVVLAAGSALPAGGGFAPAREHAGGIGPEQADIKATVTDIDKTGQDLLARQRCQD